jgi:hypothetical protein
MNARALIAGLIAGLLLSASRAPLGLDLIAVPAVGAWQAALFRAGALVVLAVGLGCARSRRAPAGFVLLAGTTLGFAAHGLWLYHHLELTRWSLWVTCLAVAGLAQHLVWGRLPAQGGAEDPSGSIARLGLFAGGAGMAVALESVARPLRLLGRGLPQDETVFAFALLASATLGAAAFGPLLASPRRARAGLGVGLVIGAAACLLSLGFLERSSSTDGFQAFLGSYGISPRQRGRIEYDLLVGVRGFLGPGLALGAALACARRSSDLASVLAGAAAGLLLLPALIGWTAQVPVEELATMPALRVSIGITLAAVGSATALLSRADAPGASRSTRAICLTACAAAVVFAWAGPRARIMPYRPWEMVQMSARLIAEVPAGLVTIGFVPDEGEVVAIDGRALTPGRSERSGEAQLLTASSAGLRFERGTVLLIGQLTPLRAQVLTEMGARRIDRCAPWAGAMQQVEEALFEDIERPPGDVLLPNQGRQRLRAGEYDLVVIPPAGGPAASTHALLERREGARIVQWLRADDHIAGRDWGSTVLLAGTDFKKLALGLVGGRSDETLAREHFAAGRPGTPPTPWQALGKREQVDRRDANVETARRLAAANRGGPFERITRALELLSRAQGPSANWETDTQATEIDPAALELLRDALLELPRESVPTLAHGVMEYLSIVCVGKREIEWLYEYFEPLSRRPGFWFAIERALMFADAESLDFESMVERLDRLIEAVPYDIDLLRWRAEGLIQLERPTQAAADLETAMGLQPGRVDLERLLAIALVRAGDPTGREWIGKLLAQDPEDQGLAVYLQEGPLPPLPPPPSLQRGMSVPPVDP